MKNIFLILLVLSTWKYAHGQMPALKEFQNQAAYPFLLYIPENVQKDEKLPVIMFLHGRSLSGNDLNMVKRYGVLDALRRGKKIRAIVIAPQVKTSESWQPDKVLNVLDFVQNKFNTDESRVYVVGMSLGGYGTLHFAGKYPERVAAAVAMCGGGNPKDACNIANTNVWIQHGKLDKAVPFVRSLEMYDAISSCNPKGQCHLTLYPKYGHGELAHEFYKDTLYNWLFQFQLGKVVTNHAENKAQLVVVGDENFSDSLLRVEIAEQSNNKINVNKAEGKQPIKSATHVVKQGDTLSSIARKHKTSVAKLCKINGIRETSTLQIGQKIKVT